MEKFTIFVLDDDEMFCDLLLSLAKREFFVHNVSGYELNLTIFSDTHNLDSAVKQIKEQKPDLMLLDYNLGHRGCVASLEVLEKIILCCIEYTNVKIITGMHPEDVRFRLAAGVVDRMGIEIIQKPFSIAKLLEIIKVSIARRENVNHRRNSS